MFKPGSRRTTVRFKDQYAFLSNFHPVSIYYQDVFFTSAEHAYQAAKCLNRKDREGIAALETAAMAKEAGRHVWPIHHNWNTMKVAVMEDILHLKFSTDHLELRRKLAETNPIDIVEDNHWNDTFWGRCNGIGQNQLGQLLMLIRRDNLEHDWSNAR
jgi:ribA/ribD-fused uncharacterized protein